MEANLELIARARAADPLSSWPDHNNYHRRTILGNWLFDYACLRCWLERVATESLQQKAEDERRARERPHDIEIEESA